MGYESDTSRHRTACTVRTLRQEDKMNIKIYINERPVEEYSQAELEEIKKKLTEKFMAAAGLKKVEAE